MWLWQFLFMFSCCISFVLPGPLELSGWSNMSEKGMNCHSPNKNIILKAWYGYSKEVIREFCLPWVIFLDGAPNFASHDDHWWRRIADARSRCRLLLAHENLVACILWLKSGWAKEWSTPFQSLTEAAFCRFCRIRSSCRIRNRNSCRIHKLLFKQNLLFKQELLSYQNYSILNLVQYLAKT